jgi:16S rRNA (adenine1518-N6/adenine1519-N6)-dimethyltransferase
VATPVISNLVASDLPWTRMVVTIQLELADRMRAQPGTGDYGALAVWLQAQCRIKVLRKLPPSVFWPRPQVDSAIVRILPDETLRSHIADRGFFHDFVRRLFTQRRKLLRGVLAGMFREQYSKAQIDEILKGFSLKETARAEELDVETLVRLANTFAKSP